MSKSKRTPSEKQLNFIGAEPSTAAGGQRASAAARRVPNSAASSVSDSADPAHAHAHLPSAAPGMGDRCALISVDAVDNLGSMAGKMISLRAEFMGEVLLDGLPTPVDDYGRASTIFEAQLRWTSTSCESMDNMLANPVLLYVLALDGVTPTAGERADGGAERAERGATRKGAAPARKSKLGKGGRQSASAVPLPILGRAAFDLLPLLMGEQQLEEELSLEPERRGPPQELRTWPELPRLVVIARLMRAVEPEPSLAGLPTLSASLPAVPEQRPSSRGTIVNGPTNADQAQQGHAEGAAPQRRRSSQVNVQLPPQPAPRRGSVSQGMGPGPGAAAAAPAPGAGAGTGPEADAEGEAADLDTGNVLFVAVESLFAPPPAAGPDAVYVAASSFPISPKELTQVHWPGGTWWEEPDGELSLRWSTLPQVPSRAALSKYRLSEDAGEVKCSGDLPPEVVHELLAAEGQRVQWNSIRRCYLSATGCNSLFTAIAKHRVWPFEISTGSDKFPVPDTRLQHLASSGGSSKAAPSASSSKGGKGAKEAAPKAAQQFHWVAYVDLTNLLFPGVTRTRVAAPVKAYDWVEFERLCGQFSSVFDEGLRPSLLPSDATGTKRRGPSAAGSNVTNAERSGLAKSPMPRGTSGTLAVSSKAHQGAETTSLLASSQADSDMQIEDAGLGDATLVVDVQLMRPLVPKRTPVHLENRVKSEIPPRAALPKTVVSAMEAEREYRQTIDYVIGVVANQWQEFEQLRLESKAKQQESADALKQKASVPTTQAGGSREDPGEGPHSSLAKRLDARGCLSGGHAGQDEAAACGRASHKRSRTSKRSTVASKKSAAADEAPEHPQHSHQSPKTNSQAPAAAGAGDQSPPLSLLAERESEAEAEAEDAVAALQGQSFARDLQAQLLGGVRHRQEAEAAAVAATADLVAAAVREATRRQARQRARAMLAPDGQPVTPAQLRRWYEESGMEQVVAAAEEEEKETERLSERGDEGLAMDEDAPLVESFMQFMQRRGVYTLLRERLRSPLVGVVREKCAKHLQFDKPLHLPHVSATREQAAANSRTNNFLSDVYVFLVREAHRVLNARADAGALRPPRPADAFAAPRGPGAGGVQAQSYAGPSAPRRALRRALFAEEAREERERDRAAALLLAPVREVPLSADAWLEYGVLLLHLRERVRATECVREALALDPRHRLGLLVYAVLLYEDGRYDVAETFLDAVTTFHPLFLEAWVAMHLFYQHRDNFAAADVTFDMARRCFLSTNRAPDGYWRERLGPLTWRPQHLGAKPWLGVAPAPAPAPSHPPPPTSPRHSLPGPAATAAAPGAAAAAAPQEPSSPRPISAAEPVPPVPPTPPAPRAPPPTPTPVQAARAPARENVDRDGARSPALGVFDRDEGPPPAVSLFLAAAPLLLALGLHQMAELALAREVEYEGRSVEYEYYLAALHYEQGHYSSALSHIDSAVKSRPKDPALWSLLGHCQLRSGDPVAAARTFELVHQTMPPVLPGRHRCAEDAHFARVRLGALWLDSGRYQEACDVLRAAVVGLPTPLSWRWLGIALFKMTHVQEAEEAFSEANVLDNTCPVTWGYLALISLVYGNERRFQQCFRMTIKHHLKDEDLLNEIKMMQKIRDFSEFEIETDHETPETESNGEGYADDILQTTGLAHTKSARRSSIF